MATKRVASRPSARGWPPRAKDPAPTPAPRARRSRRGRLWLRTPRRKGNLRKSVLVFSALSDMKLGVQACRLHAHRLVTVTATTVMGGVFAADPRVLCRVIVVLGNVTWCRVTSQCYVTFSRNIYPPKLSGKCLCAVPQLSSQFVREARRGTGNLFKLGHLPRMFVRKSTFFFQVSREQSTALQVEIRFWVTVGVQQVPL